MKINKYSFLIYFFLFEKLALAQAPAIQWAKCFGGTDGDWGEDVIQTRDGGFMICGRALSDDGDVIGNHNQSGEAWLIKTDSVGIIQWNKCFGGSRDESANSIKETPDGGYIFAGEAHSVDGDVSGLHGTSFNDDYWIVKIDSIGNIQWQKCLGGTMDDEATDIILTNDGGYIATGNSNSMDGDVTGNHNHDHWVVKIDSVGNLQWQKALGSYDFDQADAILKSGIGYLEMGDAASNSGDVTGLHDSIQGFGYPDAWVVKLDNVGNIIWQKCYGGSFSEDAIGGLSLQNGNFLIGGSTDSNDGNITGINGIVNAFLLKIDSMGNILFHRCFGQYFEEAAGISATNDGGVVMTGRTGSNSCGYGAIDDFWIVKIDSSGNMQWSKCLGGYDDEDSKSIRQTSDGGYIVVGTTTSPNGGDVFGLHSNMTEDYWVVKLSPAPAGISEAYNQVTDFTAHFDDSGNLGIGFFANNQDMIQVGVIDITGREIYDETLIPYNGYNTNEIYIGKMGSGVYMIKLLTKSRSIVKKMIVN